MISIPQSTQNHHSYLTFYYYDEQFDSESWCSPWSTLAGMRWCLHQYPWQYLLTLPCHQNICVEMQAIQCCYCCHQSMSPKYNQKHFFQKLKTIKLSIRWGTSKLGDIIMVYLIKVYMGKPEVCSSLVKLEGGVPLLLFLFISFIGVFVFVIMYKPTCSPSSTATAFLSLSSIFSSCLGNFLAP